MRLLRTFVSVVVALLIAASLPAVATAHSSRMDAIRQLPIAVQAERSAQLEEAATQAGALGTYWDQAADQIVVVTPASGNSSFKASDVDQLGLNIRVETRDIEQKDIVAIEDLLEGWKWDTSATNVNFVSLFDARKGKVVIASESNPAYFQYFQDHFPGEVEFVRGHLDLQSRLNDSPAHWGGAQLNLNGSKQCSSGFSVRKSGTAYMMTAQHCYSSGQTVYGGTGLNWGTIQYVASSADVELIGGSTYGGSIYVGGATGTGHAVHGASDPVSWNTYCVSGVTTYEHCGHTYAGLTGAVGVNGHTYTGFAEFTGGTQTQGGDSGAPWYFYDPQGLIYVAGVHTGLVTIGGITYMIATPWSKAASSLGVSIITG
jgi:hypothetical protein